MIATLVIFLPMFTSLLWMFAHRLLIPRSDTYNQLLALLLFVTLFLFYDSCYADSRATLDVQVLSILVAQASTPCLVPLVIIYLRKLRGTPTHHPLQMLWVIAPAALLTSGILLLAISGPHVIANALSDFYRTGWSALEPYKGGVVYLFFVSTFRIYHIVNYIELVWLLIYLLVYKHKGSFKFADLPKFFFSGGEIRTHQLQMFNVTVIFIVLAVKTPIFKDFINNHNWLMVVFAVLLSLLVFWFSFIALFGSKRTLRLSELGDGWRYNYGIATKDEVVGHQLDSLLDDAEDEAIRRIHEKFGDTVQTEEWQATPHETRPLFKSLNERIFSAVSDSWDEERRLSALQKLMLEEQIFLQPRLTLGDVAEKLDSNTSYVSRLVNNAYNLGFPEFINTLRIDYAEQYILNHREAKQDEIAANCGFLSASSFNNTFKKITGMTPKVWVASVDRENHSVTGK